MTARRRQRQGFALAPILYILALAGVGGSVLFSGYSQVLAANMAVAAKGKAQNDTMAAGDVLAADSVLDAISLTVKPPAVVALDAEGIATTRLPKMADGSQFSGTLIQGASGAEIGVLPITAGISQTDPYGRYYIYCRWESSQANATAPGFAIISAGADGKLQNGCEQSAAPIASDDLVQHLAVANIRARAGTWQARGAGKFAFGIDNSAKVGIGTQNPDAQLDVVGDGKISGEIEAASATINGSASMGSLTASSATISGGLNVNGTTTIKALTATGNATINGDMTVTGSLASATGGAANAPAYAFGGDKNTGAYNPGADNYGIATGGYERLRIDEQGRVGIGTAPSARLHVSASGTVSAPLLGAHVLAVSNTGASTYWSGMALLAGDAAASLIDFGSGSVPTRGRVMYSNLEDYFQIAPYGANGLKIAPNLLTIYGSQTTTGNATVSGDLTVTGKINGQTYTAAAQGHADIGGGVRLQWGTVTFTGSGTSASGTLAFERQCTAAVYSVTGSATTTASGAALNNSGALPVVAFDGYTLNGARWRVETNSGAALSGTVSFNWQAVCK